MTPGTWLRTVVHLTPRQMLYQSLRRLRGPAQKPASTTREGFNNVATPLPPPSPEGSADHLGVRLFGLPPYEPTQRGWTPEADPLYVYTLHYHGWLSTLPLSGARAHVEHWIDNHPEGIGWEPYPTAVRVLHWLGWLGEHESRLDATSRRRIFGSLAAQIEHLRLHVEHHLDGNHVWTDLAALASAALSLEGPATASLAAALPKLAHAVDAQLGPDGVHRERTPTYHCLLAEQLAGVIALDPVRVHPEAARRLEAALARMLSALPSFTHPDGDVALWNDSQLGAPVTPRRLAARLHYPLLPGPADAPDAGLFRRAFGPWTLLWNAGGVGLPQQPGHIHADGLAFELSLHEERVLIDAGVGTYTPGFTRDYARSTRAHNTVTVGEGDPDQHELWASHRVGGRARTENLSFGPDSLEARIHGYRAAGTHHRKLHWDGKRLLCEDRVEPDVPATARFFFPETCALLLRDTVWHGRTAGGQRFRLRAPAGTPWACSPAHGWTAMNRGNPRRCLAAPIPPGGLVVEFIAGPG
ncbi:MAG: heparinase II/III-family protein [Myxococcales bacterium]|nr:heparinase II/III-family protein [Myxococcales bacterium]